jgi:TRAP-type C4-dicarboxylate transport system permease small subunit
MQKHPLPQAATTTESAPVAGAFAIGFLTALCSFFGLIFILVCGLIVFERTMGQGDNPALGFAIVFTVVPASPFLFTIAVIVGIIMGRKRYRRLRGIGPQPDMVERVEPQL